MATKIITGSYLEGYTLASAYSILSITNTAYVEGSGLTIPSHSPDIVAVYNLGSIFNTSSTGPTAMVNLDGVTRFVNGDYAHTSVTVTAYNTAVYAELFSGYSRVINYGTLLSEPGTGSHYSWAVSLKAAQGSVRNGTNSDTTALIQGGGGVYIFSDASVANYGTIKASTRNRDAVLFETGGSFTNGSSQDPGAVASGMTGFAVTGGSGQLTNYGVVQGGYHQAAVDLNDGGSVDNHGRINGPSGVTIAGAAGTVVNNGRIVGNAYSGLSVEDGGTIVNGSASDQTALIDGHLAGVDLTGGGLTNFGVIASDVSSYQFGVEISDNGTLVNGSTADTGAVIEGYRGLDLGVISSASNFGLIEGLGAYGAAVGDFSRLVNGAPDDRSALIEGSLGVNLVSNSVLTNFGTIEGTGGEAVDMDATSTLAVEPDSVFIGSIVGHLGVLDLAAGDGTLSFGHYEDVVVSGSMATTTFGDFGEIEIAPQASFALPAVQSVDKLQKLVDEGTAAIGGTLTSTGAVVVTGTLAGGTLALPRYGSLSLREGADLTLAEVAVSGGTAGVETSLDYAGTWAQTGGVLDVAKGAVFALNRAADSFAGALEGPGEVAVTGTLTVGTAGASVRPGAVLETTDLASNAIVGAGPAATLTNFGKISGAGDLGGGTMALVNASGGVIVANGADAMTIDTGSNTIQNAGEIASTASGGVTVESAVDNTGLLFAANGNLTVDGAVTGAGRVDIDGASADFASTFTQNVDFTGTTGVLELAKSGDYSGEISGFSKTVTTALDLEDIPFVSGATKASYSGTTTSGVLTVADGSHVARITLEGNYTTSALTVASDGHGGTKVVDPAKPAALHVAPTPPLLPFIAAASGMGASVAGWVGPASEPWRSSQSALATPRP